MNIFLKIELERILKSKLPDIKIEIIKQENFYLMFNAASDLFPVESRIDKISYVKSLISMDERKWNEKFALAVNPMDLKTYDQLLRSRED
jgi:hypothetical protein